MMLFRCTLETPIGPMTALASDTALCALEFTDPKRLGRLGTRLHRWFAPYQIDESSNAILTQTRDWLAEYFIGAPTADDLPLDMRGAPFELRVWAALGTIPRGETTTYGEIARRVGSPGASRAVGMANGANPIALIVPCHRVIGSNGTLTGYGGGLDRKAWLLEHEKHYWCSAALSGPSDSGPKRPAPQESDEARERLLPYD